MIPKSFRHTSSSLLISVIFFFTPACKKSTPQGPQPSPPPSPPTIPVVPKTFPVLVKLVGVNGARISWVPPQRSAGDTLTYDVYLENVAVALKYKPEDYYFSSLLGQKAYNGRVVARFPKGDTMSTEFSFTTLKGTIFLVDKDYNNNGFVRCYDLSGSELWKFQPPFESLSYTFLSNDTLYSFSRNRLYCLNANDGSMYWSKAVQNIPERPPVFTGNKILYMSDLKVTALNRSDGSLAWQSARYSINSRFVQIAYKDLFFMRVDYESLYAFDVNSGAIRWQMQPPSTYSDSYPAVANDMIIVTNESEVYAIDAFSGTIRWTQPIQNPGAPVTRNGLAYISSEGMMTAIEIATGKITWQKSALGYSNSNPAVDEKNVYGLSFSEPRSAGSVLINAFDLKSGALKWSTSRPNIVLHQDPIAADGILYFISVNSDVLHELNTETGAYIGPINYLNLLYSSSFFRVRENNYYPAQSALAQ